MSRRLPDACLGLRGRLVGVDLVAEHDQRVRPLVVGQRGHPHARRRRARRRRIACRPRPRPAVAYRQDPKAIRTGAPGRACGCGGAGWSRPAAARPPRRPAGPRTGCCVPGVQAVDARPARSGDRRRSRCARGARGSRPRPVASVSTQTVASVGPTCRSSGPSSRSLMQSRAVLLNHLRAGLQPAAAVRPARPLGGHHQPDAQHDDRATADQWLRRSARRARGRRAGPPPPG